jgi:eukaryotic-like serine/threonine-protein kinase
MPIAAATRLGPYEIVAPLGEGGMGEVYRARDVRLGRDVAVKVLPQRLAVDPAALARFEREVHAVAALSHPNILAIFDVGHEAGVVFAVTELLEGETLRDRLRAGPLPLRKALECAAQVAQGLAAAHDKGIVHRDLKPENIFLSPDGRAKILDFGLAKPSADGGDTYGATVVLATDPGAVAGTPPYMAPEQVRAEPVTAQTDIFAFGAVLFEMLTGRRAFQGRTAAETMTAVLREDPPDVSTIDPGIPATVALVVRHCLEKSPAERFHSARDVAFHLQSLAGTPTPSPLPPGVTVSAPGATPSAVTPPFVTPPVVAFGFSRMRLASIAVALVVVAAAGIAAGWWLSRSPSAATHFTRVSYTPKAIFRAAYVPEKDAIVYSAAPDGNRPVVFRLGREFPSAQPIGLPLGTHLLSVSPSGELALLVDARIVTAEILRGTLARMPIGAQTPRPVLEDVRDADWSADGKDLAVVRGVGEKDRLEFPPGHVVYETDGYLTDLHASPDGGRFAMFEHTMKWEGPASLVVVDRAGKRTTLAGEYGFAHGLAWRPDGKEIVYSASARGSGDTSVFAVDLGGRSRVVLQAPGSLTVHDVSGAGEWLVSRDERREGIRALVPGENAEREVSWLDQSEAAALTEDGKTLLFTELAPPAGASGTVCLRRLDGTPPVMLGSGIAQGLSPDGQWALAVAHEPPQLLLYPVGTGQKRTLPRGSIETYRWASWFPDGRRVLTCGTERGRAARCYVQDLDGGVPRPVTPDGQWGLVAPDGQRILAWRPESAPVVYRVDGTGGAEAIPGLTADDMPARWTGDGKGVLVYRPRQVPGQVDRVDLASGRREMLRQFSPTDRLGLLSIDPVLVSADGAAYAYTYTRVLSTLFRVQVK